MCLGFHALGGVCVLAISALILMHDSLSVGIKETDGLQRSIRI
jgi:hypothetical protein